LKANHNKDYSVVKTFKAAQVAFFISFLKSFIEEVRSVLLQLAVTKVMKF